MSDRARPLIVHVVYAFAVGGLENGVVNLINRLPQEAWRHLVVSLTQIDASFCRRVQRTDVEYVALNKGPGHAFRLYPRLFRLFRERNPAIVHTRNLAALEAVVPAWFAGVTVRVHGEHGLDLCDLDGSRSRYRLVRRAYSPFVSQYVVLSTQLRAYLEQSIGIAADRIEEICNGVDTVTFCPAAGGRETIEGCPFDDTGMWLVGTVGRLESIKDQANLARAFVQALQMHPSARARMRLVIVGDGTLRSRVETILKDGGVRDLAWLSGERADVPTILRGLNCFVLPSLSEGISNTLLEAMASGLPTIATRVGGNPDLVDDGVTGQLVPPDDSDALAQAIARYFEASATALAHGRAGRRRAEEHFSLERMVDRYHRLYGRLLGSRDADAASPSRASGSGTPA